MFLVRDVLANVRDVLQDTDATEYRYPDASLLRLFNLWQLELRRGRPDAFIGMFHLPTTAVTDAAQDVPFPEVFVPAAVKYIAGMAEARDDDFTQNSRAVTLINAAKMEAGIAR